MDQNVLSQNKNFKHFPFQQVAHTACACKMIDTVAPATHVHDLCKSKHND